MVQRKRSPVKDKSTTGLRRRKRSKSTTRRGKSPSPSKKSLGSAEQQSEDPDSKAAELEPLQTVNSAPESAEIQNVKGNRESLLQREESTRNRNTVAEIKPSVNSAYHNHVDRYTTGIAFRAETTNEPETPRSVATIAAFLAFNFVAAFQPSVYYNFFGAENSIQKLVLGILFAFVLYCFLHSRDSIVLRPHPGVWRLFHGVVLHYLFCIVVLACVDVKDGLSSLAMLFPSLKPFREQLEQSASSTDASFANSPELQVDNCEITWSNIKHQFGSMWFYAHAIGFWAKFCVLRDWRFCVVQSAGFEFLELSMQWLIPEFRECWWDSIIIDFFMANMLGMVLGAMTLRLVNARDYNWVGKGYTGVWWPLPLQFLWMPEAALKAKPPEVPTELGAYSWSFFEGWERLFQTSLLLMFAFMMEVNSFFLIHTLSMPAQHWIFKYRLLILCFGSVCAVSEHFQFMESTASNRRLGHNAWLIVTTLLLETIVVAKYGTALGLYDNSTMPPSVYGPWVLFLILGTLWCQSKFSETTTDSSKLRLFWVQYGGWISVSPLLLLMRFYIW